MTTKERKAWEIYQPADVLDMAELPSEARYRQVVDEHNAKAKSGNRLGRHAALPLREPDRPEKLHWLTGRTTEERIRQIQSLANDPVRFAAAAADSRRPVGVPRARHGVAIRHAAGDRMLTAQPSEVKEALRKQGAPPSLISAGLYERMVVKPKTGAAARAGRSSSFWGERSWAIHRPKYGRGFFIRYDTGGDSRVYQSIADLRGAVKRSGFEIIR